MKNIKSKFLSLLLALCLLSVTGMAALAADQAETSQISLSMKEAYSKAVDNSKALQAAGVNIDRYDNAMNSTASKYQHDETTEYGYKVSEYNYDNSKKTYSDSVLQMQSSVYASYINVLLAEKKLALSQVYEQLAKSNLEVASTKNLYGMLSHSDYDNQKIAYQAAQTAVETNKQNLESAYLTFNSLVGLKPEARPVLTDEVIFGTFSTESLLADMDRAKDTSLSLWQTMESIDLIQNQMDDSSNRYDYDDLIYQRNAAQLQVNATETALEDKIRSLYNSIKTAEQTYYSALQNKTTTEQNYTVGKVNYQAGMCTQNTLDSLNYAKQNAEYTVYSTVLNHALDVAQYQILRGDQIFN